MSLSKIYYDPSHPASYGGRRRLQEASKKDVDPWLKKQDTYTLHRPIRRRFRRNRVLVGGLDEQWQADLVDMASAKDDNDGHTFVLTVIDVLSKYAWAVSLPNKRGPTIRDAFKQIFKEGRKPEKLQTDDGPEFLNKSFQTFLTAKEVEHFSTFNRETKASVVERFNRSLKTRMYRYFTHRQTRRYLDILPKLLRSYNRTCHGSTGFRPVDVTSKNQSQVWRALYGDPRKRFDQRRRTNFKFKVGDHVRISKAKKLFDKGYLPNWTEETFVVSRRLRRDPPVYKLIDLLNESIEGTFYEQELQRVAKRTVFTIEKVLRRRTRRGRKEYFVKWRGYPDKFNSWIDDRQFVKHQ